MPLLYCQRDCLQIVEVGVIPAFTVKTPFRALCTIEAINLAKEGGAVIPRRLVGLRKS